MFTRRRTTTDTPAAEMVGGSGPAASSCALRQQWDDLANTDTDLPALDADVTDAVTAHGEKATRNPDELRVAAERHGAADQSTAMILATEQNHHVPPSPSLTTWMNSHHCRPPHPPCRARR